MTSFFVRSRPTANWSTGAKSLGDKVVSTSTTQGLGMCFEVTTAGTSSGSEPAWNYTIGATTTDSGGVVWTCRGGAGIWLANKAYGLGDRVVKVSQTSLNNASSVVWECTTAGNSHASTEPTWPTTVTAGTTTQTDNTVTWTARRADTWDNAHPFIAALCRDATNSTIRVSAGDTIYMSKGHAETTLPSSISGLGIQLPGTLTNPNKVLCVDDTGQPSSPTTLATTGKVQVTVGNTTTWMALYGFGYWYGVQLINNSSSGSSHIYLGGGSGGIATNQGCHIFDNCTIQITSASATIFGTASAVSSTQKCKVTLVNCTVNFGNSGNNITLGTHGDFVWKGGSLTGTAPAGLFYTNTGSGGGGSVHVEGVDLSNLGANKVFGNSGWSATTWKFRFVNCKTNASTVYQSSDGANEGYGSVVADFINCGSAGNNYKLHRHTAFGDIDEETTKIKSGGASDGTTGIAHKMVSGANATWLYPLEGFDLVTWNDNSGSSKTATVEILTDSATQLNNDDVWLELDYLKDSGDPLGGIVNNTKADILTANAAQPTSSVTWTTTGITNVMKQKLQVSFTPQQKGPVRGRVLLGKASATVYVDPVLTIT